MHFRSKRPLHHRRVEDERLSPPTDSEPLAKVGEDNNRLVRQIAAALQLVRSTSGPVEVHPSTESPAAPPAH